MLNTVTVNTVNNNMCKIDDSCNIDKVSRYSYNLLITLTNLLVLSQNILSNKEITKIFKNKEINLV